MLLTIRTLALIADLGLAGIIPFIGIFFSALANLRRIAQRTTQSGPVLLHQVAVGLQAGLVGYMVCAFFSLHAVAAGDVVCGFPLYVFVPHRGADTGQPRRRSRSRDCMKYVKSPLIEPAATPKAYSTDSSSRTRLPLCPGAVPTRSEAFSRSLWRPLVSLAKPTGHFRVAKVGNRWLFVTPDGNPFWMFGVWNIVGDDHLFPAGTALSYSKRTIAKYGDADLTWGPQQVRRLKSWGFNTIGPYSVSWVTPTQSDNRWPGDHTQPVKAPYVFSRTFPGYCLTNSQRLGPGP